MPEPDDSRSHTGFIVLTVICIMLLYWIYNSALNDNCNVVSGQGDFSCLGWGVMWWACLPSTILIFPVYAFFSYRKGKNTTEKVELNN
jgi:hypothetical protein